VAQLLYTRAGDLPVGLCVTRAPEPPLPMTVGRQGELSHASWRNHGYAYVVVGNLATDRVRQLAEHVSASLAP
jgi:anti-sigma factor RsiW